MIKNLTIKLLCIKMWTYVETRNLVIAADWTLDFVSYYYVYFEIFLGGALFLLKYELFL
jgi:hypothetical protein